MQTVKTQMKKFPGWIRDDSFGILTKYVVAFWSCPKNMAETKFKSNG